jgi:hypothetical protein
VGVSVDGSDARVGVTMEGADVRTGATVDDTDVTAGELHPMINIMTIILIPNSNISL